MPIDPRIPLGGQQQPFNSPFQRLAEIRQQQQQEALNRQAIASNQSLEAERRQQIAIRDRTTREDAELRRVFASGQVDPNTIFGIVGPVRGADILKGLAALDKEHRDAFASTQQLLGSVAGGLLALPEPLQAESYATTRKHLIDEGLIRPEAVPEAYNPAWVRQQHIQAMTADKQEEALHPKPIEVTGGASLMSPQGTVLGTAPKPEEHSAAYKEWDDYKKTGGTLGFDVYMAMDANRKRPVSITNAATDDKMIEDAARNILSNPRDLTSVRQITSLRGDQRLKLFNRIKELNPSFNVGNIDRQIKFLDSYEDPKGRAATNRSSMNNILMHSADLSAVNQQYRRTNLRLTNTPIAVLKRQGGTAWTQFQVPLSVLKDEIGLYFAGGYAPNKDQQQEWDRLVNDTATPAQVEQFAKDLIHVGLRRADTANESFKTMMGYDDPNLITPDAVKAAQALGLGEAVAKYGSGGQIGAKPETGRVRVKGPKGETGTVPAGTALPAGWTQVN